MSFYDVDDQDVDYNCEDVEDIGVRAFMLMMTRMLITIVKMLRIYMMLITIVKMLVIYMWLITIVKMLRIYMMLKAVLDLRQLSGPRKTFIQSQ